eukprot:COSAG02_NODE_10450_length_1938_cov_1.625884_1_plen_373_part_00
MDQDTPGGAGGAAFDCSWRKLAYSYAPQLQAVSTGKAKQLFDALELGTMCNETFDASTKRPTSVVPKQMADWHKTQIWVQTGKGSDGNKCTEEKEPCETLHDALYRARKLPCRGPHPPPKKKGEKGKHCDVQILLRSGTCAYTAAAAAAAAAAVAAALRPHSLPATHPHSTRRCRTNADSDDVCCIVVARGLLACSDHLDAGSTNKLANVDLEFTPADSGLQIAAYADEPVVISGGVEFSDLKWEVSPKLPQIHTTTLTPAQAALLPKGGMTSLRVSGKRATRARFPNANPEIDLFPKGYVTTKTTWLAPVYPPNKPESKVCNNPDSTLCGPSKTLTIPVDGKEWHGMYQVLGLTCSCWHYVPPPVPRTEQC